MEIKIFLKDVAELPPSKCLLGKIRYGKNEGDDRKSHWVSDIASLLESDRGVYFICLSGTICKSPEIAQGIRLNILFNNSAFLKSIAKRIKKNEADFDWSKRPLLRKKGGTNYFKLENGPPKNGYAYFLREYSISGDRDVAGELIGISTGIYRSALGELIQQSRIIKIGKAANRSGLRGRLNTYPAMQAAITRFVFCSDSNIHENIDFYYLKTGDFFGVHGASESSENHIWPMLTRALESDFIKCFKDRHQFAPPWEQQGRKNKTDPGSSIEDDDEQDDDQNCEEEIGDVPEEERSHGYFMEYTLTLNRILDTFKAT